MELQFITNEAGIKQSGVLPFPYWQLIEKELNELKELRNKLKIPAKVIEKEIEKQEGENFMEYLEVGLKQVRAIEKGKLPEKTFKELQNEE